MLPSLKPVVTALLSLCSLFEGPTRRLAPPEWVSVADYGALGDGATDDTSAVMAAATALANNAGGGVLFFPPGNFLVSQTIMLPSNSEIRGSGTGATTITRGGGSQQWMVGALSKERVSVRELTLDGNSTGGASNSSIFIDGTNEIDIHAVVIKRVAGGSAIRISGAGIRNVSITACRISDIGGSGIQVIGAAAPGTATRTKIDSCIVRNTSESGVVIYDLADTIISANRLANECQSPSGNTGHAAVQVMQGCSSISITGNSISGYSRGVWAHDGPSPPGRLAIVGNSISETCQQAIWLAGGDCTVTGNVVDNACRQSAAGQRVAILVHNNGVSSPHRVIVSQNIVKDNATASYVLMESGIVITGGDYHVVTNNIVAGTTLAPIVVSGSHSVASQNLNHN